MKLLSKTFYKLHHKTSGDPYWSSLKKFDWESSTICFERTNDLWEIPPDAREIYFELHNKSVPGSYKIVLEDYFAGCFMIDGAYEVLGYELTDLLYKQLTKHKRVYVRLLY